MNTCEVFERAIKGLIAEYCPDTIPSSWLRCSQNQLDLENIDGLTKFPQVLITANPKQWLDEGATWDVFFSIQIFTLSGDDRGAIRRADMYEGIENLFDKLFACADDSAERARFIELVREERPTFHFGGFTPDGGEAGATIVEGVYQMNFGGTLHFSL